MNPKPFIPLDACKERRLYRIRSRNLRLGVFRERTGGFLGLREKFGSIFVFEEFHWDTGEPFGTVQPVEELPESLPDSIVLEDSLGSMCGTCEADIEYRNYPDGPRPRTLGGTTITCAGEWHHTTTPDCAHPYGANRDNQPLFDWLKTMGDKYPLTG